MYRDDSGGEIEELSDHENLQKPGLSSPQKEILYDRASWIKACFNGKLKRIHNPPKNREELIEILKRRFQDLREKLEKAPEMGLSIRYIDQEGENIEVETSNDLI